jgi:deoxyribodipyrimidine photolyase
LVQLHHALARLCPARGSDSAWWRDYYLRCAAAYEQIAEIDRGRYHESLYCAGRERRKAEAIAQGATGPVGGVNETL